MFETTDDIETLKRIGSSIGYGNSCDILCTAWDEMLQQKYGVPPWNGHNWAAQKRHAINAQEEIEKRVVLLRAALVALIGADGKDDLQQMEMVLRQLPAPESDKAVSINAIHALLATFPE